MGHGALTGVFRQAGLWLLLPVSAIQGLWLRHKALRLPGAPGARVGTAGSGEPLHLLAVGDSIIDGVGITRFEEALPAQFAEALSKLTQRSVSWKAEGKTGLAIAEVLDRLDRTELNEPPDIVLVSVGVNDVTGLSSIGNWRLSLEALLERINHKWPGALTVFLGLPPMDQFPLPPQPLSSTLGMRSASLDRAAAEVIAGCSRAVHVPARINSLQHPFCKDGFHPAAESCTLWARELAEVVARRFAE